MAVFTCWLLGHGLTHVLSSVFLSSESSDDGDVEDDDEKAGQSTFKERIYDRDIDFLVEGRRSIVCVDKVQVGDVVEGIRHCVHGLLYDERYVDEN